MPGLDLDESDEDWTSPAHEATEVLLDVSRERARHEQGLYDQPTTFDRRAIASRATAAGPASTSFGADVAPASFASTRAEPAPTLAAAPFAAAQPLAEHLPAGRPYDAKDQQETTARQPDPASGDLPAALHAWNSLTQIIVPAGLDIPEG